MNGQVRVNIMNLESMANFIDYTGGLKTVGLLRM